MFLRIVLHLGFCLAIVLCSASAFAQTQFGSARGTVEDAEGQPIPGASLVASSELQGSTTAYTDKNGRYRIESLIPGTYQLEAGLVGFQSVLKRDIRISVGSVSVVDFVLEPQQVAESVIIRSETPLIDSTTTAISHIIPPEIIQGLPQQQDFRSLLALTPGVGDDGVAYGSSRATPNRVWIDGVDMSSPANGGIFFLNYPTNWIEEVQVVGNGAPAEYGNYAGVIGNFVTRSGGNQFHGLMETFFHNEKLDSTNVPNPDPEIPSKSLDLNAQIGGPIIPDKLWFFSGFQYSHSQTTPYGYDGVTTGEFPEFIIKLTYKPNPSNTIQGFAKLAHSRFDGGGAGLEILPETTTVDTCDENSSNATWISLLTAATTLEARFGVRLSKCDSLPRNGDIPSHANVDGVTSGNATKTIRQRQFRPQGNFALTHYSQDYLGIHEFKFGVQFQTSSVRDETSINGGFHYTSSYAETGDIIYTRHSYLQDTNKLNGDIDQVSVYVHDSWNLNTNFSLSLGLRWDHNRGSTDRGVVNSSDPVVPRIGAIWKIRENKPIVIKAHYGDYYDALLTRRFVLLSDQPFGHQSEDFDNDTQQWLTDPPAERVEDVYFSDPDNKHPFIRQFTVGMDQELPAGIAAGVHYIYRRWHNILEDVELNPNYEPVSFSNPVTGETITVYSRLNEERRFILTNPEGLYKRYDGLEVSFNRRFMNQFALSASFVYSKIRGNIPNEREVNPFTEFLNDPNDLINSSGRLINDPTFAWKASGVYDLPHGLNLGFFFRHQSGDTWEPLVDLDGIVNQGGEIFGLPRGSFRLPSENILDMRVEKQFAILSGQFRFTVDIFNVMNAANVIDVERVWGKRDYGQPTQFGEPRVIRLGLRYTF